MPKRVRAPLLLCAVVLFGCVSNGSPNTCSYNGQSYQPGDSFTAQDGCNVCSCGNDGQVACSKTACLSDGGHGGPGDGGDAVMCFGGMTTFPTFNKLCTDVSQCTFGIHQTNCCGSTLAIGFNSSEQTRFDSDEQRCRAQYPACGCPAAPTETEDGQLLTTDKMIVVHCDANRCMTAVM